MPSPKIRGALGRTTDHVTSWVAALPDGDTGTSLTGDSWALTSSEPLGHWSSNGAQGWYWGQPIGTGSGPHDWRDTLERTGSAGLSVDEAGAATLCADPGGVVPVFMREVHGCLLFATSVDDLVKADAAPLNADPQAWAEIIAGGMVMSDRTTFREIRRLSPGATCRMPDGRLVVDVPDMPFVPDGSRRGDRASATELIERVRAVVDRIESDDLVVPLSGGWDSRLLAAVAVDTGRSVRTVTSADQYGRDEEPLWAAEVASRLGVDNRRLPPPEDWWQAATEAASLQDYLTSKNHWLLPMARHTSTLPGPALDGLAGDAVIRLNMPASLATAEGEQVALGLRDYFAPLLADSGMLSSRCAAEIDELVEARFRDGWRPLEGQPGSLNVYNFKLRTVVGVGLSPMKLLAAYTDVATPFTLAEVLSLVLSVHPTDKVGGRWYPEILAQLPHRLHEVPSTNDTTPVRRLQRRADLARHVAQATAEHLEHPSVAGALGPRARAAVTAGTILERRHDPRGRIVRGLVLYSMWAERYEGRLADSRWPFAGDTPATGRATPSSAKSVAIPRTDRSWLDAQDLAPSLRLQLTDGTHVITGDAGGTDLEPCRTVSLVGAVESLEQLDLALGAASALVRDGGRVVASLALPDRTRAPSPELLAICELLSLHLDLVHVQPSSSRLRLVGRRRDDAGSPRPVHLELVAAALEGLEQRVGNLKQQHHAAVGEADASAAALDVATREARAHAATLRAIRNRRSWRIVQAVAEARRSVAALVRLPGRVVRIVFRRD